MKHFILILFLMLNLDGIGKIAEINAIKKQAQEAFESGNYREAVKHYTYLIDSLKVSDEKAVMNLGHAYYKLSVLDSAFNSYKKLSIAADNKLRSVANQQLGVIANKQKDKQAALNFFKEALKADPANEDARYNYELLKKQLEQQEQKQQDKDQQDKNDQQEEQQDNQDNNSSQDQQNKENQQKENEDQQKDGSENQENGESRKKDQQKNDEGKKNESEKGEEKKDETKDQRTAEQEKKEQQERPAPMMDQQKLQEMNISPEKAKMILDAMRNSEVQYLQQMQKKPTKRRESNKPDW